MAEKDQMEKLVGDSNWPAWQILMRAILECEDVYEVVDGSNPEPEEGTQDFERKKKAWMTQNKKAKKKILFGLDTAPLLRVGNCRTARDVWTKLSEIYDSQCTENLDLLRHRFHNVCWDRSKGVQGLLAEFDDIQTKLGLLNAAIPEPDVCSRFLQVLPAEFDHVYVTWHDLPQHEKTWNKLQKRCLNFELRINNRAMEAENSMAFWSKKNDSRRSSNHDKGCYNCGKMDHIRKDCKQGVICYSCNEKGHKSPDCPKKRVGNVMMMKSHQKKTWDDINLIGCDEWFVDSGASHHVTNRKDWFIEFKEFQHPYFLDCAKGGVKIEALGSGSINTSIFDGQNWQDCRLENVWYCPEVSTNLFSVKSAVSRGIEQRIDKYGKWWFYKDDKQIGVAVSSNGSDLFRLLVKVKSDKVLLSRNAKLDLQDWHERFGHQSKRYVREFLELNGVEVEDNDEFCTGCLFGKQKRITFGERVEKSTKPGELVFADLCGPMEESDLYGHKYFLVFKDDYTSFRQIYLIKRKDEVKHLVPKFVEMVKVQAELVMKELRTDNGTEFDNKEVKEYAESIGMKCSKTTPYSPQQNGVAERENGILCEMARSWIHSSGLPKFLWGEAVATAAYTLNRTGPTKVKGKTPIELFLRKNTSWQHLKIFGSPCYAWIPQPLRRKFDAKSRKGYFVGYADCGYRIYFPDKKTVEVCRDVEFECLKNQPKQVPKKYYISSEGEEECSTCEISTGRNSVHAGVEIETQDVEIGTNVENVREQMDEVRMVTTEVDQVRDQIKGVRMNEITTGARNIRDRNSIKKPERFQALLLQDIPKSYDDALKQEESQHWIRAMQDEIDSLNETNTWILVECPENRKIIDSKWVFSKKLNENNEISRFKARLVARGFNQIPGVDFYDTFSPVARLETMRILLALTVQKKWVLKQFDVKTAFLNGNLEEDVFMRQPKGYDDGTGRVFKLMRSLYGLKQSSKCWYKCLTDFLNSCGFNESCADPCLFFKSDVSLMFHVDDGLVMGTDEAVKAFMIELGTRFNIRETNGECFLGIHITYLDGIITINQSSYIERLLEKFELTECNSLTLPIEQGWSAGNSNELRGDSNYREMVGSLLYLTLSTRPDLAYAVNIACRAQDKPTLAHLNLVKRIFRYLKGTKSESIIFKVQADVDIEAFSDADFAGDRQQRKSTTGILVKFAGAPVIWKSKLQKSVALSSMEAEYIAASDTAKSVVWIDRLLKELSVIDSKYVPKIFIDNQSAIKLIGNPMFHERSKHIETRYHYVRNLVEEEKCSIEYIPTKLQQADLFTKGLTSTRLNFLKSLIGMFGMTSEEQKKECHQDAHCKIH